MKRPYLIDGNVTAKHPSQIFGWLFYLLDKSYLLRFLNIRIYLAWAETIGTIEDKLSVNDSHFKKAVNTTSLILKNVKQRTGKIPIVAFCADRPFWVGNTFEELSNNNDIVYVDSIPEFIEIAKKNNINVDGNPYDSHWNLKGHEIAGKRISNFIKKRL